MTTFSTPSAELAVELSDEGGAPVVQLHGLTSSRARDRVLAMDLGRGLSGTRLLRYDARGHGKSTGRKVPQDYVWQNLADDLLSLLDAWFPGEQVHGVGPSMGTATLLHAAVKDPERFRGLTLLIPPTAWQTRVQQGDSYRAAAQLVENGGFNDWVAAGRTVTPPPATAEVPFSLPQVKAELLPSVLRGAAASDLPQPEQIAGITVPVTILAWTGDPGHPLSTAEALHEVLPQSTLSIAETPAQLETWPHVLAADVARTWRTHQQSKQHDQRS